jgi:hypothetical protein
MESVCGWSSKVEKGLTSSNLQEKGRGVAYNKTHLLDYAMDFKQKYMEPRGSGSVVGITTG